MKLLKRGKNLELVKKKKIGFENACLQIQNNIMSMIKNNSKGGI